jgi:hypothetical protein
MLCRRQWDDLFVLEGRSKRTTLSLSVMPATRAKSQNSLQEAYFVGFRYNEVDHILDPLSFAAAEVLD